MQLVGYDHSGRTNTHFPHLKELDCRQVGEEDAEEHKCVPNIVAVSASDEVAWVVSLGASLHVYVNSSQIGSCQESNIWY